MFKTLASGEPIEARLPYCEPFTMSDYAKLIFNVNRLDNANIEHTHGFYRRILIIPFEKTIADEGCWCINTPPNCKIKQVSSHSED